MNIHEMISQMGTGMPSEAPAAAPKPKADPGASLKAAHAAHAKGDHAGAKKHALKAVNALHKFAARPPMPAADPAAGGAAPC